VLHKWCATKVEVNIMLNMWKLKKINLISIQKGMILGVTGVSTISALLLIPSAIASIENCEATHSSTHSTSLSTVATDNLASIGGLAQFFSGDQRVAPVPQWFNHLSPEAQKQLMQQNSGVYFQDLTALTRERALWNPDGSLMNEYKNGGEIPNNIQSLIDKGFFNPEFKTEYFQNGQLNIDSPFFPKNEFYTQTNSAKKSPSRFPTSSYKKRDLQSHAEEAKRNQEKLNKDALANQKRWILRNKDTGNTWLIEKNPDEN